tara:strand:- start:122 stop:766 length:645 start_codon:yes stop_codon:yes gene_type:complete
LVKINPDHGAEIADGYDALRHSPNEPETKASYDALIGETREQYNKLTEGGLKVTKLKKNQTGYTTADEMHKDIASGNLKYFATEHGYGANSEKFQDNPMLTGSGIIGADGKEVANNDLFRIVHDINGHNLANKADFSPEGEHSAFLKHREQYTPLAGKALFTETAGQANWGIFNKKSGESNMRLISKGRESEIEFAEQKAGLFPDSMINKEYHS